MPNQLGTRPYQLPGGAGVGGVGSATGELTGMRMPGGAGGLNISTAPGLGGGLPQPAGGGGGMGDRVNQLNGQTEAVCIFKRIIQIGFGLFPEVHGLTGLSFNCFGAGVHG